ncbi:hypothetical protein ABBQ32_007580 [Trebouxia sp. C0010 RCD-2024]
MNVSLILVDLDGPSADWQANIRSAVDVTARRLYVYFEGKQAHDAPDEGLLALLARYYNEVADLKPQLDLIPLLPFASWSLDRVAMLSDVQAVLGACRVGKSRQLAQDLNYRRAGELQPLLLHPLGPDKDPPSRDQNSGDTPSDPTEPTSAVQTAAVKGPLLFSNTAVGGTFDRLHAGHRILLTATALVTTTMVYVGVTSDLLLQHKEHAELLQSYDERRDAAVKFIQAVRPELRVQTAALRDPQEPTGAATMPEMEAIVVSKETVKGAHDINLWRQEHGSTPLTVVTVDLVGRQGSSTANKLSSTRLRMEAAQRLGSNATP